MNLNDITSLIQIRTFIESVINTIIAEKQVIRELSSMKLLLDKKIISLLQGDEFKEYIEFSNEKKIVEEAVKLNNIKSGIKK